MGQGIPPSTEDARVVGFRIVQHVVQRSTLDDAAVPHHHTLWGHCAHHIDIILNQDIAQAVFALQLAKQLQDLLLYSSVEALVGSSSTTTFGFTIRARAMAMRWRCPPENSCGYRCSSASAPAPSVRPRRTAPVGCARAAARRL